MNAATTAQFSTSLAMRVLEERLHRCTQEVGDIDETILKRILESRPTAEELADGFADDVDAVIAAEAPGSLGLRLAKLRDDGEELSPDEKATVEMIYRDGLEDYYLNWEPPPDPLDEGGGRDG